MNYQTKIKSAADAIKTKHYAAEDKKVKLVLTLGTLTMLMVIGFGVVTILVPDPAIWSTTFVCLAVIPIIFILKKEKAKPDLSLYAPWEEATTDYMEACGVDIESMEPSFDSNAVHYGLKNKFLRDAFDSIYTGKGKVNGTYMDLELKGMKDNSVILFGAGKEIKVSEA